LREGNASTEELRGPVGHLGDAHVAGAAHDTGTGHAGGHLHLGGEIHDGCGRDTRDPDTRDVLGHHGRLEGRGVGSAGRGIDHGHVGTGTVLVDLVDVHRDDSAVIRGWETCTATLAGRSCDTLLLGSSWGFNTHRGGSTTVEGSGLVEIAGSVVCYGKTRSVYVLCVPKEQGTRDD
jgi:hypothetical protein